MIRAQEPSEAVVNLTNCADEPIHLPGSIQPHGLLFVLDEPGLTVRHVSANVGDLLGLPPGSVLGAPLADLAAPEAFEEARGWLLSDGVQESAPRGSACAGPAASWCTTPWPIATPGG